MIGLTNPSFLWTLAGLGIPVAIHLLSQKPSNTIYMGSLRHLTVSFSRQFTSIRLNQLLLLLLRMLLIVILVLILAGMWWTSGSSAKKWMLFEKGTERDPRVTHIRDSLAKQGYEIRLLTTGFPPSGAEVTNEIENYWQLSAELAAQPVSDAVIFSWLREGGFQGIRPAQPANQHWIAIESPSVAFPAQAVRLGRDSIRARIGKSSPDLTEFKWTSERWNGQDRYFKVPDNVDSVPIANLPVHRITIVTDAAYENDKKILVAILKAIQQNFPAVFQLTEAQPADSLSAGSTVFWLSGATPPKKSTGRIFILRENVASSSLLKANGNQWIITRRLGRGEILDEDIAVHLASILLNPPGSQHNLIRNDRRTLTDAWSSGTTEGVANHTPIEKTTATPFLFLAFLILLIAERSVAAARNH